MNTIHLRGCRGAPLLSYLAGLGVIRMVAEQLDPDVSARWDDDHVALIGGMDETALIDFFVEVYEPTPLIAPWNGRGGFQDRFQPVDRQRPSEEIVMRVECSDSERLGPYRQAIKAARDVWEVARGHDLIEGGEISKKGKKKCQFVELCRATFPDEALAWLDASVVLLDDDIAYPLILGTGGNIGSLDLSFSFLKQLDTLGLLDRQIDDLPRKKTRQPDSRSLIRHVLFRDSETKLSKASTGQFDPGGVGGPNSSSTGDADPLANPWSFVLGMEGAMVFASAAARRLSAETPSGSRMASMPFTVAATAVGYGSASIGESSKGEFWAPLWRDGLSYREIRHLISEGRSQWGRNQARSGLDFVRAAATLGVDRSVDEFVRYLLSVRHGQNVLAVPIGRFKVSDRVRPEADLLRQLDGWVVRARSNKAPGAVAAALNAMNRAQFAVATFGGARRLQAVLGALADAEQAASRSHGYREDRHLRPVGGLLAREWLPRLDDGSAEFRVAVGLASLRDRAPSGPLSGAEAVRGSLATLLRSVNRDRRGLKWSNAGPRVPNLAHRPLFDVLCDAVGARAALAASKRSDSEDDDHITGLPFAFDYGLRVDIADIGHLLSGQLDEDRLGSILAGLLLLDWKDAFRVAVDSLIAPDDPDARLYAASHPTYVVLAPFFAGRLPVAPTDAEPSPNRSISVRPRAEWIGAIRTGAAPTAARSAAQLLRGRGWKMIVDDFERTNSKPGSLATALLLHLGPATGEQRQIRFLLSQQSTAQTHWLTSQER